MDTGLTVRILAHPDPIVLERELLSRLDAGHPLGTAERSLIVVPTTRLAAHLSRRLVREDARPAWLGVEVLTFRGLAFAMLDRLVAVPRPRIVSPRLREAIVRQLVRNRPGNAWSGYVTRRPGALGRLAGALNDLREAGIEPDELRDCVETDPWDRALAELYRAYADRLVDRRLAGWTDEAGLIELAVATAPAFAGGCRQILFHGAYELIGAHLRLLEALAESVPVTLLWPMRPGAVVTAYAEEFAREHLAGAKIEWIAAEGDDGCGLRLEALYDESSRPEPAPTGRFAFRHCQGPTAEVQTVLHEVVRAVADGCPADEIAVVARSLEPFAAAIEGAFEERGLNWTSSLAVPLGRQPFVRDFLLLLRVVDEDFPRRPTAALLRSPRVRWNRLAGVQQAPNGDRAELWSRRARILGGLVEWCELLPAWAAGLEARPAGSADDSPERLERIEARRREARRLVETIRALHARVAVASRSWSEHARELGRLLDELFEVSERTEAAALAQLHALLDDMARLESLVDEREPVSLRQMRNWLEDAVGASELEPWEEDRGGVRVLDAMQFRGLTFRRVFLLGLNSGMFPRRPTEDPVLGDSLRERLRGKTGKPLPVKASGVSEERLLLALLLGGSRAGTEISWQRADDAGRARSISLALREIARLAFGSPDLERLRLSARTVPSHPRQWLDYVGADCRVLSAADTMLLAALQGYGERALDALGDEFPELRPGVRMLKATQSFELVEPGFDARIDRSTIGEGLSVSELVTLGRCPLQFFFSCVLGVRELEQEAEAHALSPRELGSRVHALLEEVYRTLAEENLFDPDRRAELPRRAHELLRARRGRLLGDLGERVTRRLPVLWERTMRSWFDSLDAFIARDLASIGRERWQSLAFESPVERELDLGRGERLRVKARFDRNLSGERQHLIGDYKTSAKLRDRVNVTRMLKGLQLQVPLYRLLAGEGSRVELLGVGPAYDPDDEDSHVEFAGFVNDRERRGLLETLRELVELAERGRFPLHADHHCSWCAYNRACRRNHPPTRHRETLFPDAKRYAALREKSTKRPLLANRDRSDG